MVRVLGVVAGCLALAGCGGMSYAMQEYSGIDPQPFAIDGEDVYRVFDKPSQNKLMITPSVQRAMAAGAAQGFTFGAVDTMDALGPKPVFERAALGYLASTGRQCRIIDGALVVRPQWEFKYDCSVPPMAATVPAHPPRRSR